MSGRFVLDTNIVLAIFAGDSAVLDKLKDADQVFASSVVLGELFYGAYKSKRVEENMKRIDEFAAGNAVLPCDRATARRYGQIKNQLRAKGRPIPENDIWIAAIAQQHDLTVVSRDVHFSYVDGLSIETW